MAISSSEPQVLTNTLTLRRAGLRDLLAVFKIEQAAFGQHALDPLSLFFLVLRRWPGFIVAERNKKLMGYIILRFSGWPEKNKRGGIVSVATHPEHLRQGVGRSLMEAGRQFVQNSGARALDLEVDITNLAAIALYVSLGYKDGKPLPDYYGPGKDGKRMTLEFVLQPAGETNS
jgi:[ribosomal protein S18]-alanine N-acetyltransferase